MAANTISTFTLFTPISNSPSFSFNLPTRLPLQTHHLQAQNPCCIISNYSKNLSPIFRTRTTRAVSEQLEGEAVPESTVAVPVSPSDVLTMFFKAEGTMNEAVIPAIYQALEGIEGVTDLKVQVVEGIASVELTKQTTVQATGVASGLVETIQGSGFKLQTLNLSFLDEEDMS